MAPAHVLGIASAQRVGLHREVCRRGSPCSDAVPRSCSLLQRRVSNMAHRVIGHCSRPFCPRNWECQCRRAHHAATEATPGRQRPAPRGSALVPYAVDQLAHESRASASPARDGCRFHEAGRKPLPLGSCFAPREPPWRRERRSWRVASLCQAPWWWRVLCLRRCRGRWRSAPSSQSRERRTAALPGTRLGCGSRAASTATGNRLEVKGRPADEKALNLLTSALAGRCRRRKGYPSLSKPSQPHGVV